MYLRIYSDTFLIYRFSLNVQNGLLRLKTDTRMPRMLISTCDDAPFSQELMHVQIYEDR